MSRLLWALFLAACLSQTTWAADPRSEAFCRELNAASTAPAPNKIYFKSDKGIVQLTDGMTVRRGQTPLYFFANAMKNLRWHMEHSLPRSHT
jgi:hypothetical protein